MMQQNLVAQGIPPEGALQQMASRVLQQATVMSFIDVFFVLALLFGGLALTAFLMRRPARTGGAGH